MSNHILNPQQKKAVIHGSGPLLIIAGAGTGKTTVITERIKHLILNKNISPKNILALTFTEKASREMQERIDIALPYGYADMWIHTFHAFCDRVLREHALHIGIATNYTMLTEAQAILFLRNHLFDFNLSYFRPLGNPDKFLQGMLQHFSRLKDEDVSPDEYIQFAKQIQKSKDQEVTDDYKAQVQELSNAYAVYESLKRKENVMDFGDLISNVLLLFRKRKHILLEYQKQFEFLLIDEFQDTNYAQNQLALLLSGKNGNITVVGDDDQAIYRWRGAAISNMLQFTKHFPKTEIVTLTKNYRSTQTILDTAYSVIQNNNPDRLEIKEHIDKHLEATKKNTTSSKITFFYEQNDIEEAERVVATIQKLHKEGYPYKDFAILVRANDHAQPFIKTLSYQNIPHQFLGPAKLFHQEEIKDLIAYLKVLYNKDDAQSLYRVLTMPTFHISAQDISALLNMSKKKNISLFDALENELIVLSDDGSKRIKELLSTLKRHLDMVPKSTAGKILYDFLESAGLMQYYLANKNQESEIKAQNTAKFFERLKQFETHNEIASVYSVVDWIDLSMELGESPLSSEIDWSENDAVNILTIHSSKGLEFPVVFIVNLVTQRFPSRERSEQIPIPEKLIKEILPVGDYHLQEERRLFYVAITRAKEKLFLTAAKNYGEGKRERKISPFATESLGEKIGIQENNTKQQNLVFPTFTTAEPAIQTNPLKISYLSYSQMQTFDICPLHYKLRYLLHIPTLPNAALSFGNSMHLALKEFYAKALQGEKVGVNDVAQILESVWISEGYMSKKHIEQAFLGGVTQLKSYLTQNFSIKTLPLELEFPFQFSLGSLKVGGRMDRIDKHPDGSIEIIDYKTGRNTKRIKNIQTDLQLSIYAMAAKCIPGITQDAAKNITLSLHYLESGEKVSTKFSESELQIAAEKITAKAREIEVSDFSCSKSLLCEDCEYVMLCQANL